MKEQYFIEYVEVIALLLFVLAICLSVLVICYALVQKFQESRRRNKLKAVFENLHRLALPGKEPTKEQCAVFMKNVDFLKMLDVYRGELSGFPEELSKAMVSCIKRPEEMEKLEKTAGRARDKWKRIEALIILGRINSPNAVNILKESAFSKDEDISYFSILSLGHIKGKETVRVILGLLKAGMISGYKAVAMLETFPPDIVEEVIKYTEDKDAVVRLWAVKVLSHFKPSGEEFAKKAVSLTEDGSAEVRSAACEFLGKLSGKETEEAIKKCLKDDAWVVRRNAVEALESVSGEKYMPEIMTLLKDGNPAVRDSVKKAAAMHVKAALGEIEGFLAQGSALMKKDSVEILEDSGYVREMLEDVISGSPHVKTRATDLLNVMIKAGARYGFEEDIESYPDEKRNKILDVIASLDDKLAGEIKTRFKK